MGERSLFVNVMLAVIAAILLAGFYFTVRSLDLYRLRQEELVREVKVIGGAVSRLRNAFDEGRFAVAAGSGSGTPDALPRFANVDLRDPNAEEGDAIISTTASETRNLNSIVNNEAQVSAFWGMTNDSLAERNMKEPTRFEPQLAARWEVSDDKLTYTIHLRKGVRWHDFTDPTTGDRFTDVEVTAHDFKFYVDVIRNPGIDCEAIRGYFEDLDRIEVVDDYTFKVIWKKRYFRSYDLTLGLGPLPRHFYRFDPKKPAEFNDNFKRNRMIVGCGPWIFDHWEKGNQFVFVRNEDYYGPKPYLRERRIRVIKDPNARLTALKNGEIDLVSPTQDQWVKQTAGKDFAERFNKLKYTSLGYSYIGYNMRKDLFKDRRVRLALTHCIDRERILREVYHGLARIVTGNFFIDSAYYDHSIKPWPFDLNRAKQLFTEAGWKDSDGDGILDRNGKKFEFTFLLIQGSANQPRYAAIMKEDLAKVGVKLNILPVEWSVYTERLNEWNFDVCSLGWALDYESDPHQLWHSSWADKRRSSNHVGFKNDEADEIIMQARREFDLDKRIALYKRFHRIMHEEQPYTFLFSAYALVAVDKRFRNVKAYPLGLHSNSFWVPKAEQRYAD